MKITRRTLMQAIVLAAAALPLTGCSYNTFVSQEQAIKAQWAQVENQLQRRNDLIPNLVETTKGFAQHEEAVYKDIADARSQLLNAKTPDETIAAANRQSSALGRLLAVVENYPNLKSNEQFNRLIDELASTANRLAVARMHYIAEMQRTESAADRVLGTSTIVAHRSGGGAPLILTAVRRGGQLAALLELLAGDPRAPREADAVRSALAWEPRQPALDLRAALAGFVGVLIAIFAVAIGLHGKTAAATYAADDALAPNGEKRSEADIIQFMEADVMPWARATFGRLKGGA